MSYFHRVEQEAGTRFWINNVTRAQARLAIEAGAVGATQNPAYLSKVIGSKDDGAWIDSIIEELLRVYPDDGQLVSELQRRVIAGVAEEFMPLYQSTGGARGLVSIQADPYHEDTATILDNAEKCRAMMPNCLIKIPATKDGLDAIGTLIAERVPVLATEVMSIDQVIEVAELHKEKTSGVKNPAPFIFAHINGIFDEHLEETARKEGIQVSPEAMRVPALALGQAIHHRLEEGGYSAEYLAGGARGLHHFTDWVGARGGVTINWAGSADKLIELNERAEDRFAKPVDEKLIEELLDKLPDFKKAYTPGSLTSGEYEAFGPVVRFRNQFEAGWKAALEYVAAKRRG